MDKLAAMNVFVKVIALGSYCRGRTRARTDALPDQQSVVKLE